MSSSTLYVISPEEAARLRMETAVKAREGIAMRSAALREQLEAYSADEPGRRIISDMMEVCNSVYNSASLDVEAIERENSENNAKLAMIHDYLSNSGVQSLLNTSHGIFVAKDKVELLRELAGEDASLKYETDKLSSELIETTHKLDRIMSANILALSEPEIHAMQLKAQDIYYRFVHYADEITKLSAWRKERKDELEHNEHLVDFEKKEIMSFQELVKTYSIIEATNPKRSQISELLAEAEKYMVFDEDKEKLHMFRRQYECGMDNALFLIKIFLHSLIMRPPTVTYEAYCMLAKEIGVEPAPISSFSSITDLQISLDDLKIIYADKMKKQFIRERIYETLIELGFNDTLITLEDEDREGEINLITRDGSGEAFICTENDDQNFFYLESVMLRNGNETVPADEVTDYRKGCCKIMETIMSRLAEKGLDVAVKSVVEPKAENCTFIDKNSITVAETKKRAKANQKTFTNSIDKG